jgi:hypothetical protein
MPTLTPGRKTGFSSRRFRGVRWRAHVGCFDAEAPAPIVPDGHEGSLDTGDGQAAVARVPGGRARAAARGPRRPRQQDLDPAVGGRGWLRQPTPQRTRGITTVQVRSVPTRTRPRRHGASIAPATGASSGRTMKTQLGPAVLPTARRRARSDVKEQPRRCGLGSSGRGGRGRYRCSAPAAEDGVGRRAGSSSARGDGERAQPE